MRVADLMETGVEIADARLAAEDAWQIMQQHDLAMLVVTQGAEVAGVVTREQLGGPHGPDNRQDRHLEAFLPAAPVTLTPECSTQHAAALLDGSTCGCVPVLDRGHLVGVVTVAGLLRRLGAARGRRA